MRKPDEATTRKIVDSFLQAQDQLVLQAADLSLETIASMVDAKSIDVEPAFQRRERWKPDKQSALIESFLVNVPVPPVYLAEDDFGTYSVIDGKQRITTINAFMRNRLRLHNLGKFEEVNGLKFEDLPKPLQNALSVRPYLRVITLLKQSHYQLKYEVFVRLNEGGVPLLPQELRNVTCSGGLNDLLYSLAEHPFLQKQLKIRGRNSAAYQKMEDAEYVLRFLTLRETWRDFSGSYRKSMDDFMLRHRKAPDSELQEFRSAFSGAITICETLWGNNAFKRPEGAGWRDQMLAGMYDAEMVAVSHLTNEELSTLSPIQSEVTRRTRELFEDKEFEASARRATNTPALVKNRIEKTMAMLRGCAQGATP